MEDSRVTVKIGGQEYTISGERDEATIIEIAAYVDAKIKEISQLATMTPGRLATLAAVNITDELFKLREEIEQLNKDKEQLSKDSQHYMKMWDDAKKNFIQYKEGAKSANDEKSEIEERCRKLEEKCSEFESSYFDLQMENIRLKDQLNKFRGSEE